MQTIGRSVEQPKIRDTADPDRSEENASLIHILLTQLLILATGLMQQWANLDTWF